MNANRHWTWLRRTLETAQGVVAIGSAVLGASIAVHVWVHNLVTKADVAEVVNTAVTEKFDRMHARLARVENRTLEIPLLRDELTRRFNAIEASTDRLDARMTAILTKR